MSDFINRKNIGDWLDDVTITKGNLSKHNVVYLREFKRLLHEFSILSVVFMFGIRKLGMNQLQQLYNSSQKLKMFCIVCIETLKVKKVTDEYTRVFDRDINGMKKRSEHMWKIMKENYRYTEYYPFFEECGWDMLLDFKVKEDNGGMIASEKFNAQFAHIIDSFNQYKNDNQSVIDAHMKSVEGEILAYKLHREKVAEQERLEREAVKAYKKAQREEAKEIERNNKKYRTQQRKVKRELEKYYGKGGDALYG